jgi:hypothetical protein
LEIGQDLEELNMDDLTMIGMIPVSALAVAITAFVMKVSAGWFDKERFGPLVSLLSGVAGSMLWHLYMPDTTIVAALVRGVVIGLGASGVWDHFKAVKAIKNNGE